MRRPALIALVVAVSTLSAGTAGRAGTPKKAAAAPVALGGVSADQPQGNVDVHFAIQRFLKQGHNLVATGVATATYRPPSGASTVVRKAFKAKVVLGKGVRGAAGEAGAARICPVLYLQLDKLSLNLLGLHVDLDKVVLTISADSKGGVLGSLFCALARTRVKLLKPAGAERMTQIAHQSGLATSGIGFAIPIAKQNSQAAPAPCQVLDLVLGPLNLKLLGLIVNLNQVHLAITADPAGGQLGSLFCSLAGH